jgi:replicative DNA helicase
MSLHDPVNPLTNIEAEAALLGALMQDNRHIDFAADRLRPEDFSEAVMGRIFSAIVMQYGAGKPATPVTLKPVLADDETLRTMGGTMFLAKLTANDAALIGSTGFVEQIAELAARRRLIEGLHSDDR